MLSQLIFVVAIFPLQNAVVYVIDNVVGVFCVSGMTTGY